MLVREADAQVCGWVVSLIAHPRCDGDPQGVGTRNKLSVGILADAATLLMDESQTHQPWRFGVSYSHSIPIFVVTTWKRITNIWN